MLLQLLLHKVIPHNLLAEYTYSTPQHIVLADQGAHWLITHDAAWTMLDNFWYNATRRYPIHVGQVG
jgi:hypothetical protein